MPKRLKRYYGQGHLHFITCSCYRRLPRLGSARRRNLFLRILEDVRRRYGFAVIGYVVMPEHVHLLVSEPARGTPSTMMQVLKQRVAQQANRRRRKASSGQLSLWQTTAPPPFWQRRFHDFNVWSQKKRNEKLHYMHSNPVKRKLVKDPKDWLWSSYRFYFRGEMGPVTLDPQWPRLAPRARSENP
jgi:putative transposase